MRECRDPIFLTLVVAVFTFLLPTFSWSATGDNTSPPLIKESIQNVEDPSLSEAAFENKREDQLVQFTIGILAGEITKKLDDESQSAIGFTYDWRDVDQNFWSLSAKWLSSKAAWIEAGKKFMILPDNMNELYYKLSVSHFMDPDDAIAGITRINSFKASASLGALDLWTLGRIFNFEVGLHWGIPGLAFHAQAGAQWAF